jgi:endosialidase-like protein
MNLIQLHKTIAVCLVSIGLSCFAILPVAHAVIPAPDGGYPGDNTAEGEDALFSLTTGQYNTAVGFAALYSDTTASFNTALGTAALLSNTGDENTAVGAGALIFNTTGRENTAVGAFALIQNRAGISNTAVGDHALESNQGGISNIAVGALAMQANTSSLYSVAVGVGALMANQTTGNTGVGHLALSSNTTGGNNTALGYQAGSALTTGDNNIDIGNEGVAGESATIRIGDPAVNTACFIAGINGATASGGTAVFVNTNGQLGTLTSSARFKENIKPMDKISESILDLQPITFHYRKQIDAKGTPQFGLVAEEVAKVNPDLVVNDRDGKPYTVRYEAVNAMLLNEFLKEHKSFIAEQRKVKELQTTVAQQQKDIEALTSGLQKVSAQVELSKAVPQTVLNP